MIKTTIYALPPELLLQIFTEFRDIRNGPFIHPPLRSPNHFPEPIVVSQVCRLWRTLAISNRSLWTIIKLVGPFHPTSVTILRLFLTRSEPSLIDLELIVPGCTLREAWFTSASHTAILALLSSCVFSRCRKLVIQANSYFISSFVEDHFRAFSEPHNFLKELVIDENPYRIPGLALLPPFSPQPPFFPQGLPVLRNAKIGICGILPLSSYQQLTSFHFRTNFVTFEQFHSILSHCHALETLALYDNFSETTSTNVFVQIEFPFLTALQLYDLDDPISVDALLRTISAPRLHDLVMAPFFPKVLESMTGCEKNFNVTKLTLALEYAGTMDEYAAGVCLAAHCFVEVEDAVFVGRGALAVVNVLRTTILDIDLKSRLAFPKLRSIALDSTTHLSELVKFRDDENVPLVKIYLTKAAMMAWQSSGEHRHSLSKKLDLEVRNVWSELRKEGLFYPYGSVQVD